MVIKARGEPWWMGIGGGAKMRSHILEVHNYIHISTETCLTRARFE